MSIELCDVCKGRGFTTTEEGTNYGTSQARHVCMACEGRGCQPIPFGMLTPCPSCSDQIPMSTIVPRGTCAFCEAKLMLLLPQCLLPVSKMHTHTLFHDNVVGAGFGFNLQSIVEYLRGPRAIAVSERSHIIYPGDRSSFSRVVSRLPHSGPLVIELGRFENQGGKIVEEVVSRAEVTITQTLGNR